MKRKTLIATAAVAAIAIGAAVLVPAYAHDRGYDRGWGGGGGYGSGMMGPGYGGGYGMGPGYGGGYGMGPGYGGPGMDPGMMGRGDGRGMMGPGMMGPGMMGPGHEYGYGHRRHGHGPGDCSNAATERREVTVDTVTKRLERRLDHWGNDRIKIGKVEESDKAITAEIVLQDGSLVDKFTVDKETGRFHRVK